jgi:ANTAR domain
VVDRGVAESERHTAGLPEPSRGEVVIRRTSTGWRVEGAFPSLPTDTVDDLGHALVLADLLAEDTVPGPRPPRPPDGVDELTRLRASVRQLEHALASRVVVEQAIGVLSERWRAAPRDAFEQLRRVTRSHGLRIHDLAKLVVDSTTERGVALPVELVPQQRGTDRPPEPRQSPDARGRGEGRARRSRSGEPVPAQANGGRRVQPPVQTTAPAPRASNGRHAHQPT